MPPFGLIPKQDEQVLKDALGLPRRKSVSSLAGDARHSLTSRSRDLRYSQSGWFLSWRKYEGSTMNLLT